MADAVNTILVRAKAEQVREFIVATAAVTPGMIIEPSSATAGKPNTVVAMPISRIIAVNHEVEGETVDESYAVGERIKGVIVEPGEEVRLRLKSGDTSAVNGSLKLVTGGLVTTGGTDSVFAKALEVVEGPGLVLARIV